MASLGSKVMQPAAIQDARLNKIEVDVRSSFNKKKGTTIKRRNKILLGMLITLIILLIVSSFFKFSETGQDMFENLSESMSNMFGNNRANFEYRGPRRIPFIGTDY